ncbi:MULTISPECIES: restriction endonuclease subunit S [Klebsiella/Raoultella group]|uniref:restriction endonuclease subunit S n=1 Tax=Klebsiella/Raoultella group TaxID=2890311 RepID=UPI0007CD1B89|nr:MULTISPECIES: restriction endonuclease subunit S [Klebsiella/Raoultella group]HDK5924161.1 restriction endonuclease subunit S [Klebsiella quasipneumoniae]HDU4531039.1 restriction endonuclease subunit S [Klebsiella pneumoniae subsp. pneumoniae]AUU97363.1 restriction endonuclease subunit S [Klebsiella pneumoniae]EIV9918077.1 restriction endonuclease subunit S [Klebsiella pneumoniae]ELA2731406.1 restriction endonuclease subunit S [Klebsiella pneumoniae]
MVPKLRFKNFVLPWKTTTINGKVDIISGFPFEGKHITDNASGTRLMRGVNVSEGIVRHTKDIDRYYPLSAENHLRYMLKSGDIVIGMDGSKVGRNSARINNNDVGSLLVQRVARIRDIGILNTSYLFQLLNSTYFYDYVDRVKTSSGIPHISLKQINEFQIGMPSMEEQIRIADFLSSVDEKITLLNKQYNLLCQYKKGMMQNIFSQELRFKDDNGKPFTKWNTLKLKDVATRVTRKNKENNNTILTISGRDGLVDQMTYFNKQIASKNVTGYYLIREGEFAYNKSYSQGYPMGAIKMLSNYEKGVVSTLYICFKLNDEQSCDFYQHYFESGLQNRAIEKVAQEGARNHGLLNIGVNDFFDIELQVPSLAEQNKIAHFLSAIEDKIAIKRAELDMLKKWKQGLLQQMLV